ncbi:MAG: class I SAM-dependent methyltransferase [Elusimicrobia bacterium]|nr:class I SAM-dependent methyltransferase [Elusimicrobiota bacterium]
MASWLRVPRRPQNDPGDPFLEVDAGDTESGRAFLDERDASFLAWAPDPGRGRVLVLGAGVGRMAVKAALNWPLCEVTCVDLSGAAQSEALDKARSAGLLGRFWYTSGDAGRLDFPDGSFDLVLSDGLLHHVREPVAFLNEAARAARRAVIRDLERPLRGPWAALFGPAPRTVPESLRRAWAASEAAAYSPDELEYFVSRSRLRGSKVRRGLRGELLVLSS